MNLSTIYIYKMLLLVYPPYNNCTVPNSIFVMIVTKFSSFVIKHFCIGCFKCPIGVDRKSLNIVSQINIVIYLLYLLKAATHCYNIF